MKRHILILGGIILLVIVLAAGAFTAARLLSEPDEATAAAGGVRIMESVMDDGSGPVSVRTVFLPAPELPDEPAATGGIVLRKQDNRLIVGTGNIEVNVEVDIDPETGQERQNVVPRTDGPEIEVVIGRDTVIYRDVTDFSANMPTESGERELQQVVRQVDTADDIESQIEIQVWGERRGDRVTADVVVFRPLSIN